MLKRPAPKNLSAEERQQISAASAAQTGVPSRIRSYDADFPVFEVPVNQKILAYVPNHTVIGPDGSVLLRMDQFAAHPIIDGRSYGDVRCSLDVRLDSLGLDGSCPLCDSLRDEMWALYNKEYQDIARTKGIDPKSPEAQEALKEDRKNLVNAMAIKSPAIWYTFPIVVIDCVEKDGQLTLTPKKDAQGRITGRPMWYQIRKSTYDEKWGAAFDGLSDTDQGENGGIPTTPAGMWVILNFTYTPKSGKHDKMGSARSLKVSFKPMQGYEQWATYFDQLTEEWTPEKAQDTLVMNAVRSMDEMRQVADEIAGPTRRKLAMYELGETTKPAVQGDANNALASFGGTPVENAGVGTPPTTPGELPLTGEMPNVGVQS